MDHGSSLASTKRTAMGVSDYLMSWELQTPIASRTSKILQPGDWVLAVWPETNQYYYGKIPTAKTAMHLGAGPPIDHIACTCMIVFDDNDIRLDCPFDEVKLAVGMLNSHKMLLTKVSLLCGYDADPEYTKAELVSDNIWVT
jgi:hypothetical protein